MSVVSELYTYLIVTRTMVQFLLSDCVPGKKMRRGKPSKYEIQFVYLCCIYVLFTYLLRSPSLRHLFKALLNVSSIILKVGLSLGDLVKHALII